MNQGNQNKLSMWKSVRQLLQNNQTVWGSNVPFSNALSDLSAAISAADAAILGQAATSTGVTETKDAASAKAINLVSRIASSTSAYAIDTSNYELLAITNISRSQLQVMPQNSLLQTMVSITKASRDILAALSPYGITDNNLTAAENAVTEFGQLIGSPRIAQSVHIEATKSIPQIMLNGKKALIRMDKLLHLFEDSHPAFTGAYKTARVIVDTGTRHELKGSDTTPANPTV